MHSSNLTAVFGKKPNDFYDLNSTDKNLNNTNDREKSISNLSKKTLDNFIPTFRKDLDSAFHYNSVNDDNRQKTLTKSSQAKYSNAYNRSIKGAELTP